MTEPIWGILGPETLGSERRTRTLGLGASVRLFNELAVPGIGGVWFCKQLMLATLGVAVAEDARASGAKVQNIETANAIEALACWLSFNSNKWARDDRLRGNNKLQGKNVSCFKRVKHHNFYVTQPMRMSTVQALPALGLVDSESSRFNGFKCSEAGREFVEEACSGFSPYKTTVVKYLTKWACGETEKIDSPELCNALSPIVTMPGLSRNILKELLLQGDKKRRNALEWMDALEKNSKDAAEWNSKPLNIENDHWHDLKVGALFFKTRDTAVSVLDALEACIGNKGHRQRFSLKEESVPKSVEDKIIELRSAANEFLRAGHPDKEAIKFCRECAKTEVPSVLQSLVKRDGNVLRMAGQAVLPGPAFRGLTSSAAEPDDADTPIMANNIPLPDGISYRIRNLYLLNIDLQGKLHNWLQPRTGVGQ